MNGAPEEGRRIAERDTVRVNQRIRARQIRLIGAEGEQLGVVTPDQGITLAQQAGLDLVEVAPNADPPVCRIMDYGKYKYEEKKKKAAGKAKAHAATLKEVKLRPGTDDHDLGFKLKNARRFLMDGDKVKVTVMFRGREMAHREHGYRQLDRVKQMLGELAHEENPPRMEGRFLSMILVGNAAAVARARREAAAAEAAAKAEAESEKPAEKAAAGPAGEPAAAAEGA